MILHLFNDEKVVDRTILTFEKALPQQNIYICFTKEKPSFVKTTEIYTYNKTKTLPHALLNNITQIIVHYLTEEKAEFIKNNFPDKIPCYWCIWGGDLYNRFLDHRSYSIYYERQFFDWKYRIKSSIKKQLQKIGIVGTREKKLLEFIRNRITNICSLDYEIATKYLGKYIAGKQTLGFSYYPIDTILGDLLFKSANGNVIWIGNSASFSNNHSYAFEYLSKFDTKGKEIVLPLSYSGSLQYKEHIIELGKKYWSDSFHPLLDFLPLEEYNRLLIQAEICIFPHWRQEAMGNIIIALYLGAKVFLSEKSPLVHFFLNNHIRIYILEQMTQDDINIPLEDNIKRKNREIIFNRYNERTILNNIKMIWGQNTPIEE